MLRVLLFRYIFYFFFRSFNRPHDRMLARNSISETLRLACKTRQRNWQAAEAEAEAAALRITKSVYDS